MSNSNKTLRRDNPDYQELKALKSGYVDGLRRLFLNLPNWKQLSREMGVLNVPTDLNDQLKLQAEIKRKLKK
ncbi:MAG TPA: hypothetical protein HA367_06155 [Candidatus Methanofastidiosum sp.]|nr:hypothetical protein [Methanofastidiosum sp.]